MQQNFSKLTISLDGIFVYFCFYGVKYNISFSEMSSIEMYFLHDTMIYFFSRKSFWEYMREYDAYFLLFLAEKNDSLCFPIYIIRVVP